MHDNIHQIFVGAWGIVVQRTLTRDRDRRCKVNAAEDFVVNAGEQDYVHAILAHVTAENGEISV